MNPARQISLAADSRRLRKGFGKIGTPARYKDYVWSYDFVADETEIGRQLRLLVVIDEYTQGCLAIEVGRWFTALDIVGVVQYLFAVRSTPEHIRSDNGQSSCSR